jgi:uncharacterized protein
MRIDELPTSDRIEDRRGGLSRFPGGRGGIGLGTIVVLGLLGWALGIDPRVLIQGAEEVSQSGGAQQQSDAGPTANTGAPSDAMGRFVSAILGSTEAQWTDIFAKAGKTYTPPTLVMFSGATQSACGAARAAMGPFYCPLDQKVYLDTSFFEDLQRRFGACDVGSKTCQFSEAYVIAHEIGHHVQNLLGTSDKVQQAEARASSRANANRYSIALELQADCFAGVWAAHASEVSGGKVALEPGDLQEGLRAAAAVGDDTLQKQTQGRVVPDSFTHGTSAERQHWLETGYSTGDPKACDTFNGLR